MKTIWAKNRLVRNYELCLVYKASKLENAYLEVVGRDVYNVYVNGEFVSYGPVRTAHDYVRKERIDISKYLTKEENYIVFNIILIMIPRFFTVVLVTLGNSKSLGNFLYLGNKRDENH